MTRSVVHALGTAQLIARAPEPIAAREEGGLVHDGSVQQTDATSAAAPKRKMFRNKFTMVRLAPDAVERQSRITLLAWNLLGSEAARAFLNNHSDPLEGRPLDLAVASACGFEAVQREINERSSRA